MITYDEIAKASGEIEDGIVSDALTALCEGLDASVEAKDEQKVAALLKAIVGAFESLRNSPRGSQFDPRNVEPEYVEHLEALLRSTFTKLFSWIQNGSKNLKKHSFTSKLADAAMHVAIRLLVAFPASSVGGGGDALANEMLVDFALVAVDVATRPGPHNEVLIGALETFLRSPASDAFCDALTDRDLIEASCDELMSVGDLLHVDQIKNDGDEKKKKKEKKKKNQISSSFGSQPSTRR